MATHSAAEIAAIPAWRRFTVLGALVLAATVGLLALLAALRSVPLTEVMAARLPCVSYAPFRRDGHSPFDASLRVDAQLIEADLRQLAGITGCVRTYGLDHGLDAVPAIARKLGLRVALGAWIGRDAAANDDQLTRAIALAKDYADVVDVLIVGNEVLLRRELTPPALAALLARAQRESPVPVAYADVWEFWLRHGAQLRDHVDRAAVHVLPYWEDDPVAGAHAAAHVHAVAGRVRAALAPLPVWVAETGWPAEGRQRGPAVPGPAPQASFVRDMLRLEGGGFERGNRGGGGSERALGFNLVEGFDQPWKRRLEGAMGGYWGVFDAHGRQRLPLVGPWQPDGAVRRVLEAAALGALTGSTAAAWIWRRRRQCADGGPIAIGPWFVTWVFGGAALAACGLLEWQAMQVWSRGALEFALAMLIGVVAAGAVLLELPRLAHALAGGAGPCDRGGWAAAITSGAPLMERWRAGFVLALLFCMATMALQLGFDGRYRALLWPLGGVAAAVLLARRLLGVRLRGDAREECLLAGVGAFGALVLVCNEGLSNGQAIGAAATWLALAGLAWPHRGSAPWGR